MFLFFFSGHGDQTDDAVSGLEPDGRNESIVLRDGQIDDAEMSRRFGSLNTCLALLVLDSCYSDGFARNVVDRPGVMGLFSSEEDLTSAVAGKFRTEVDGVEAGTVDGQRDYQNLVIDRGGVQVDDVILRLAARGSSVGARLGLDRALIQVMARSGADRAWDDGRDGMAGPDWHRQRE